MKHFRTILAALLLCAAPAQAQTLKSLMVNTTSGVVAYPFALQFQDDVTAVAFDASAGSNSMRFDSAGIIFGGVAAAATRTNLGLGSTNNVAFNNVAGNTISGVSVIAGQGETNTVGVNIGPYGIEIEHYGDLPLVQFVGSSNLAAQFRADIGLGTSDAASFGGITNNGNVTINQSTTNNGLLFIYRTNNEPFLGLANLIASNNTTISNETLFRVGVAEATNKAAQFGFRSTNTNGNGVAVFSVFGYNALMMIGADASTNAIIYSGGDTNNEVLTLIKNGATEFSRPIAFSSTAHAAATRTNLALGTSSDPTFRDVSVRDLSIVGGSGGKIVYPATNSAPADTTNPATWIQLNVGTNAYRVPLYQ